MSSFGVADQSGRSSGKLSRRDRKNLGPPKGEPFIWLTRELLRSTAWKSMSVNGFRLINLLLIDQMAHAGRCNGRLMATKEQMISAGISSRLVSRTVRELEALKLVSVEREAMRIPSKYELTFCGTINTDGSSSPPTNKWKLTKPEHVSAWKEQEKAREKANKLRREKQFPGVRSEPRLGSEVNPESPLGNDGGWEESPENRQIDNRSSGVRSAYPYYILGDVAASLAASVTGNDTPETVPRAPEGRQGKRPSDCAADARQGAGGDYAA